MTDNYNKKILKILAKDGKISNLKLAEAINLSPAATHRRVKKLEKDGKITGYIALINKHYLQQNIQVIVRITLNGQDNNKLNDFERQIKLINNVVACYLVGGDYDYLIRIAVKDIAHYEKLHKEKLSQLPYVYRLQSNFALKEVVSKLTVIN